MQRRLLRPEKSASIFLQPFKENNAALKKAVKKVSRSLKIYKIPLCNIAEENFIAYVLVLKNGSVNITNNKIFFFGNLIFVFNIRNLNAKNI